MLGPSHYEETGVLFQLLCDERSHFWQFSGRTSLCRFVRDERSARCVAVAFGTRRFTALLLCLDVCLGLMYVVQLTTDREAYFHLDKLRYKPKRCAMCRWEVARVVSFPILNVIVLVASTALGSQMMEECCVEDDGPNGFQIIEDCEASPDCMESNYLFVFVVYLLYFVAVPVLDCLERLKLKRAAPLLDSDTTQE